MSTSAKAAGCRRVNGGGCFIEMHFHQRPLLVTKNDQRKLPACKVLLAADVFAGALKHVVPGFFSLLNQLAVFPFVPTDPPRIGDLVAGETPRNQLRSAVVE